MGTDCSSTAVSAFELDGAASDCTTTAAVRVELVVGASFVGSLSSLPERRFTKSDPSADISPWISRCSTAVGACGRDQGDAIAPLPGASTLLHHDKQAARRDGAQPDSEATTAMMTVVSSPSSPLEIAVSTPSISTYPGSAYGETARRRRRRRRLRRWRRWRRWHRWRWWTGGRRWQRWRWWIWGKAVVGLGSQLRTRRQETGPVRGGCPTVLNACHRFDHVTEVLGIAE